MKLHYLKLQEKYWNDVMSGMKGFELRKNDRDFKVGDLIIFVEADTQPKEHVIQSKPFVITYVLKNVPEFGLNEEYAILSIERVQS